MPNASKPIAYTVGEPAGIGPDIILQLAAQHSVENIVVLGDSRLLAQRAAKLNIDPSKLTIEHIEFARPEALGQAEVANVPGVMNMLNRAIDGCLNGEFAALVTGPVHKGIINDAGVAFSGHTEYLAERSGAPKPVMLLATNKLRVALMTTHLPLSRVSHAIDEKLITEVCTIVAQDLQAKFGLSEPRLMVCGLNPHAGEDGHLGSEEIETITPALDRLRAQGLNIIGPVPADTAFTPHSLAQADVVIAMYHDQGLPVLKSQGFGEAANITLGLPIIRTSVDHGTAFDLAGSGKAQIGGLQTAFSVAQQMVNAQ